MDDELAPPVKFDLLENQPETRRCPWCLAKRAHFVCTKCIKTGFFVHSSAFIKERFVEKQIRLENIKKALKALDERAEEFLGRKRRQEDLTFDIQDTSRNITWLREVVEEKRTQLDKDKTAYEKQRKQNSQLAHVLPRYEDKVKKLEDYLLSKSDELALLREKHKNKSSELQRAVRWNIESLVHYIFPIRRISDGQDTEGVIAEASRTVLIRGKWHTTASDDGNYLIVAPYLPTDGDYNIYNDWVLTNRGESLPSSVTHENLISNSAYRICAALTYATQLVILLSKYLDVRLPYRLANCDFSRVDLPETRFNRRVSRLNANILHICYTQNVDLRTLKPAHTLENLHKLLCTEAGRDIGRVHAFVDRERCLGDEEDWKLAQQLTPEDIAGVGVDSDEEGSDESQLTHEWETIPPVGLDLAAGSPLAMPPNPSLITSITSMFGRWTGK